MAPEQSDQPMTVRATAARWALGLLLALGAIVLLLKPGGLSKVLALILGGGAAVAFVRRSGSDAAIVAGVLLAIAGFFLLAFLTGNSSWITDRY